jgi:RNA polymerase sigma factor (sigma-70 family)
MMPTEKVPVARHNDAELVAECLEGRRDAFGRIVERYQSLICSLAYSATGSLGQSEDLAQETFLVAWQQLPGLREPASLRPWLCGIARNLIGKALRRDGREPLHAAEPLEAAQAAASTEPLPPERAIGKEEEAILWRSVERIPEIYREPLVLFYREHRSVEKVAAELDLTEDTVRQRLSRGRKLLHQQVLAFIEGALEDSNPGKAFTVGVLAALPLLAASATGASVATASGVAAKGGATAKTISGATGLGAVLTGGVIFLFSLLGFLAFLGSCIGYIMGRAIRQSARQLEYATRFWRCLSVGFGAFVGLPCLIVLGLRLKAVTHPKLYQGMSFWMGLIYVLVAVALALWLWRWSREYSLPGLRDPELPHATTKRFLVWFALGMLVPAGLFGWSLYDLAFTATLSTQHLTGAEFQKIVRERKDAQFSVSQYENGRKTLIIKLPESRRRIAFLAPADDVILAVLAENHISYKTHIAGRDLDVLGMPVKMLVFLSFVLAPTGAVTLLTRPWRPVAYQQQTAPQQAEKIDIRARNAFRAFAVATALALLALAVFIGLLTRWGTHRVSAAELPNIIAAHRFAQYVVSQYSNGSSELDITPHEDRLAPFVAPADAATLSLLKEQGIPYHSKVQGRDFGYRDPTPLSALICIVTLTTGAALLLWWAGKGTRPWSPTFRVAFLVVFLLVFGATILLSPDRSKMYVSMARMQVADWTYPGFPQDESSIVKSEEALKKVIAALDLNRKWGKTWGGGHELTSDMTMVFLKNCVWADAIRIGPGGAIEVNAYDWNPDGAAKLANAVANVYREHRNEARPIVQIMDAAVPGQKLIASSEPVLLVTERPARRPPEKDWLRSSLAVLYARVVVMPLQTLVARHPRRS